MASALTIHFPVALCCILAALLARDHVVCSQYTPKIGSEWRQFECGLRLGHNSQFALSAVLYVVSIALGTLPLKLTDLSTFAGFWFALK